MTSSVTAKDIQAAIRLVGLTGKPVCIHSSLRSFGHVAGGADTLIDAFLDAGCTVLVPTFSWSFAVPPPPDQQFPRNAWDYASEVVPTAGVGKVYTPESTVIDWEMGAVPAAVLARHEHVRGYHPLSSFAAVGALADDLIARQTPLDVFAPLSRLAELGGRVVLMGVDLRRLTLLHLAEQRAGRNLFRRSANGLDGKPIITANGGCSEGFYKLEPLLDMERIHVGQSLWRVLAADHVLERAVEAIRSDPQITHCGVFNCARCNDAAAGGPIVDARSDRSGK